MNKMQIMTVTQPSVGKLLLMAAQADLPETSLARAQEQVQALYKVGMPVMAKRTTK